LETGGLGVTGDVTVGATASELPVGFEGVAGAVDGVLTVGCTGLEVAVGDELEGTTLGID